MPTRRPDGSVAMAVRAAAEDGLPLAHAIDLDAGLVTEDDLAALVAFMRGLTPPGRRGVRTDLAVVAELVRDAHDEPGARALAARALPELERLFDVALEDERVDPSDTLGVLAALAVHGRDVAERVSSAIRRHPDHHEWHDVLRSLWEGHPSVGAVVDRLRGPLPSGSAVIADLDLANEVWARGEGRGPHPFATPSGVQMLHAWIAEEDPELTSYAESAICAANFLPDDLVDELLDRGDRHPMPAVRTLALAIAAARGDEAAVDVLAEMAGDPRTAWRAIARLRELGHEGRIPAEVKKRDFQAVVEMVRWLEHGCELGRTPDRIEVADTRVLYWPPTGDERRLWVIRYEAHYGQERPPEVGQGLVGSVTFSLARPTADLHPLDVYALHCCFELRNNRDPRASGEISAQEGRALLERYNPALRT